ESIEIFTDVNGMMTADPRVVESASSIDVVTYAETSNLAHHGAKVIHPRAVEIAMQAEIPIRISSTYLEDEEGNLIKFSWGKERKNKKQEEIQIRICSTYLEDEEGTLITSSWGQERGIDIPDRLVTGIAHIDDLAQLLVSIDKDDLASQAKIFRVMEEKEISVNFINISASFIAFTIPMEVADEAEEL